MKDLHLNLIKKWYVMTGAGVKQEDYRQVTPYWFARLVFDHKKVFRFFTGKYWGNVSDEYKLEAVQYICHKHSSRLGFKPFRANYMANGYSKTRPTMLLAHNGIEIREGVKAWGAEEGVKYFVIKHGALMYARN